MSREESIENQMRSRLNDDVLSLAFCKAIGSNPKTVSWQCLFAHSKEEYGNDINRELFAREQLQQRLYIAMRSSAFVRTLLELKLKCSLSDLQKDT